jgi:hypothetical protein
VKVQVYVNQDDEAKIKAVSENPVEWVRGLVRHATAKLPEPPPVEIEVPVEA